MKTIYKHNDTVISNGSVIDGLQILVLYDGTHAQVSDSAGTRWVALSDIGVTIIECPECWHFNRIACRELAVDDRFGSTRCTFAGEGPMFSARYNSCASTPPAVLRIPNPEGLSVMPMPEGHRIHNGTPQMKLHGRWVDTAHVEFCGSTPYDNTHSYVYAGCVEPIADSVDVNGSRVPKRYACNAIVDESGTRRRMLRDRCREVDGKWYEASLVWVVVNRYGGEQSVGIGDPPALLAQLGDSNRYAALDDTRTCYGNDETYLVTEGERWCGDWYSYEWLEDNTFVCCDCDERRSNDDEHDDGRCECCDSGRYGDSNGVRDYCDRSANNMKPEKDVPIKFGIELEVEPVDSRSESIDAFNLPDRYCVLKEDGSLGSSGYEIVTRPDCPSVHKRIFGEVLKRGSVSATTRSWQSGRCGIHIHVSRAPLSQLWVGRMLVFINSEQLKPIVSKVAGRYGTTYSSIGAKKLTDGRKKGYSRYDALNTSGDNTIEFRIFRGTLNRESFLKNIEFVEAVLAFCKPCTCSNRDVNNASEFVSFLRKRRKEWPHLWDFLVTKGLAPKAIRA